MAGRVGEHPPSLRALLLRLPCSQQQQRCLRKVEVIHLEVEVRLLRLLLSWPARGAIPLHALEPEEEAVRPSQPGELVPGAVNER